MITLRCGNMEHVHYSNVALEMQWQNGHIRPPADFFRNGMPKEKINCSLYSQRTVGRGRDPAA